MYCMIVLSVKFTLFVAFLLLIYLVTSDAAMSRTS